jgi:hypothetical protein
MSTQEHAPSSGREDSECLSLAARLGEDNDVIDDLLFGDEEWLDDFDGGWILDQSLEDAGIIIEQNQEGG